MLALGLGLWLVSCYGQIRVRVIVGLELGQDYGYIVIHA